MSAPRQAWSAPRRAVVLYVGTIVAPGLVLIYLGVQSAWRQQAALESLTHTSERLSVERLAREAEQRTLEQAEQCLDAVERSDATAILDEGDDPYAQRKVRATLETVVRQHPIAWGVFLFQDGVLRFPQLRSPLPRSSRSLVAGEPEAGRDQLGRLLDEAEQTAVARPDLADRLYANLYERAATAPVKALALARRARCASQLRHCDEADTLFRRLVTQFPDEYDPYGRPYALPGWLYLSDGTEGCPPRSKDARRRLIPLLREVPGGHWELSGEVANYYVVMLQSRTGVAPPTGTPYLQQFEVAEAFSRVVARYGTLAPGERHAEVVRAAGEQWEVIYQRTRDADRQTVVALVVNLEWVRATLLPNVARRLGMRPPLVVPAPTEAAAKLPDQPSSLIVPFRTVLSFWQVGPSPESVNEDQVTIRRGAWVLGGATVVVFGMLVIGLLLLNRDIRREAELSAVKTSLVSGVSHELKTPLTVIRLYAETLSSDPQAAVEERLAHYDVIMRESERLTTLIDKVLDYSRIERGQRTYHLAAGDLRQVVEHTVDTYEGYLRRRGFHIERDIRTPPPVLLDPDAVAEALVNLLDNAVKYSNEARWIGVRLGARQADALLEVQDRGVGIAESDRRRIFDQFFRAGRQTGTGGYGLGLFLVKHIMDAHGGSIELDSEPGRGSVFRLVFPGAAAGTEAGDAPVPARNAAQA